MANYSEELLRALANGDKEAHEQIKDLPLTMRMGIGIAVDELKKKENIVPMDGNGGFSIYEQKKVTEEDRDELGNALQTILQREREAEELREKIRQEHAEKIAAEQVRRARAGLARTDR